MVLVWLRGLRDLRTKIAQPPQPSPPPQPRAHKIEPKSVRTLHEGSRKKFQSYFLRPTQSKIVLVLQSVLMAGWRAYRLSCLGRLGAF
jgi:hypothetical protein